MVLLLVCNVVDVVIKDGLQEQLVVNRKMIRNGS